MRYADYEDRTLPTPRVPLRGVAIAVVGSLPLWAGLFALVRAVLRAVWR